MSSALLLASLPVKAEFVGPTDYPDATENCALFEVWSVPPDLSFYDFASDYFWCQPASLRFPIYADPFSGIVDEPFAMRLRGYVTIPESGEYQFEESSTGESILMIGEDGTPFSKIPVDSQTPEVSPTPHRFMLEAGQKIYLEAIQLQVEPGPVNLDWAWVRPDGVHEPIPAYLWESFSLRSDDADDNGLPDTFENSYGIAPPLENPYAAGFYGWAGDFNQNGFTNLEEYQTGNSPTAAPTETPSTPNPPPRPQVHRSLTGLLITLDRFPNGTMMATAERVSTGTIFLQSKSAGGVPSLEIRSSFGPLPTTLFVNSPPPATAAASSKSSKIRHLAPPHWRQAKAQSTGYQ